MGVVMEDERLELLAQVAMWYYEERLDQAAIAERIGKSRSMVSRLLDQAREAGLVEVRVHYPLRTDPDLENQLCDTFGLQTAHVLAEPPEDYSMLLKRLGELASRCITQVLHPGIIIGLSWGTAVHAVVRAMPTIPLSDATVVQLIGAIGHGDPLVDGAELGRWLAQKLHASFRFLSAPLLVEDEAVAKALRRERTIEETLMLGAKAEVAIIGIGTPEADHSSMLRAGYLTRAELQALLDLGVVGDVVAHQFDAEGRLLDIPANRRTISVDADSLRRIPKVVAVSGGKAKTRSIHAALIGRFCSCLVTDAVAARGVLAMEAERQSQRVAARA